MAFIPQAFTPSLRNIFRQQPQLPQMGNLQMGGFQMPEPEPPPPQPGPVQMGGMMDWRNLAPPATPGLDAYMAHIQAMPQRTAPGKWNRVAAAMAGFGTGWQQGGPAGIQAAQGMLEQPYRQRYTDWAAQGAGMKEAADIEQNKITNQNRWYSDARKMELDWAQHQLQSAKTVAEIQNIHSQIQTRGMRLGTDENGNQVLFDIQGQSPPRVLFKTNVETPGERQGAREFTRGTAFGVSDRAQAGANQRAAGVQAGQDRRLGVSFGQQKELELLQQQGRENIQKMPARPTSRQTNPMEPSASEQQTADQMALREIARQGVVHPVTKEQIDLAPFIDEEGKLKPRHLIGGTGARGIGFGRSREEMLEIYDALVDMIRERRGTIAGQR